MTQIPETRTANLQINSSHRRDERIRACEARAANSPAPLRIGAAEDKLRLLRVACVGAALLSACLVPAATMGARWFSANIGGSAFVMTFGMAFGHAVLLGLPLFLIFRSKGWVNVATCAIAGFTIGAGPATVLSWPTQHPQFTAVPSTIIDAAVLVADWVNYLTPPMQFGMFGTLGGIVFWLVLTSFDVVGESTVQVRFLQSRRLRA